MRTLRSTLAAALAVATVTVAACGGGEQLSTQTSADRAMVTVASVTAAPVTAAPVTVAPPASAPPPPHETTTEAETSAPPTTAVATIDDGVAAQIESLLAASIADFDWSCCGADGTPSGASVAIRIPGLDDTLITVGTNIDGTPMDPEAQFSASNLSMGLVHSVAYRLIDTDVLDPTATVETWAPQMPDASTVTVQMLLDSTTGWGDFAGAVASNVVEDLERVWTLGEVVEVAATIAPTGDTGFEIESTVLGYIMEQVTGVTLSDLVSEYVTEPLGLDDTTIDISTPPPPDFQHGVFVLDGSRLDTASVPDDAYLSFLAAAGSARSTLPDLLDLLDAWVTGELLGPDRAATPDRFPATDASPDMPSTVYGKGLPLLGYLTPRTGGEVLAIGRRPNGLGTTAFVWYFPDTGISIVMHHNSQEWASRDPLTSLVLDIHDLVGH
jgi:hypothetical protein